MSLAAPTVRRIPLPQRSRAAGWYDRTDLADAYAIALPDDAIDDPEQLARHVFGRQPRWIGRLMRVRDAIVQGFGLKTAAQLEGAPTPAGAGRIRFFRIYERRADEIVLGEDDRHLDFRVSVLQRARTDAGREREVVLTTVVHCHNLLGRTYIALIAPFHRLVVQASLRAAARAGWPRRAP
ncbi:MAG: DUF2867 domain-containing protein [Proteobacteria bacterium]|nr:DUF2867 domain-containing protein [Pseudomonadota bacterium]